MILNEKKIQLQSRKSFRALQLLHKIHLHLTWFRKDTIVFCATPMFRGWLPTAFRKIDF